jgi:hypothetical protein
MGYQTQTISIWLLMLQLAKVNNWDLGWWRLRDTLPDRFDLIRTETVAARRYAINIIRWLWYLISAAKGVISDDALFGAYVMSKKARRRDGRWQWPVETLTAEDKFKV